MKLNGKSFEIILIDDLKVQVESIRNVYPDSPLKKKAGEVLKKLNSSDECLVQTSRSLQFILKNIANCDFGVGEDDGFYKTVISFLQKLSVKGDTSNDFRDALLDFSRQVESIHSLEDDDFELALFDDVSVVAEADLENLLSSIDCLIDSRDQLIFEYGEVLAFVRRLQCPETEFDRRVELNETLRLISFIKDYHKRLEEDARRQEEARILEEQRIAEEMRKKAEEERKKAAEAEQQRIREEEILRVERELLEEKRRSANLQESSVKQPSESESCESEDVPTTNVEPAGVQEQEQEKTSQARECNTISEEKADQHDSPIMDGPRADVLFVLDASGSMLPCFNQLKDHLQRFVAPFKDAGFASLRLGLLAYSANKDRTLGKVVYRNNFLCPDNVKNMSILYGNPSEASRKFFTESSNIENGVNQFIRRLDQIKCRGDEDTAFALDTAADFPFEPLNTTRRVIILFTDEPVDDGVSKMDSMGAGYCNLEKIMEKVSQRHISLYFYGPKSAATDVIEEYPRVFFNDVVAWQNRRSDEETWEQLNVGQVLENLGKSISGSALSVVDEPRYARATYGQDSWSEDSWN